MCIRPEHGFIHTPVVAARKRLKKLSEYRGPAFEPLRLTLISLTRGVFAESQIVSYGFIFHCAKCMNIRTGASLEEFEGIP